jgi:hypothetical protein
VHVGRAAMTAGPHLSENVARVLHRPSVRSICSL